MTDATTMVRRRVAISGVVQGVGFRPYVWRRATRLGLTGWVENDAAGIMLEVQGPAAAVTAFLDGITTSAPPLAAVGRIEVLHVAVQPAPAPGFAILASPAGGRRTAHVPPDIAPCPACLAELADPGDRRYRYPFVNCTDCGPRFTIIEDLPYDRAATTMRGFGLCPRCAAEYASPADRRFHAEPVACPACGPVAWYAASGGGPIPVERSSARCLAEAALAAARDLLARGGVLAIKGVGGVHVACDATDAAAVARLRARKQRPAKPFAVMVADAGAASRIAAVSDADRRLLEGRDRPIVLMRQPTRRHPTTRLAADVAPGLHVIGVMLPSSPLHQLLCEGMPPLVMTSGNLAEEPIAIGNEQAAQRLGAIVDGFLMHDRPIHTACDDSVVRGVSGGVVPIRRSRGQAPLPIRLAGGGPPVLAVGGELKATLCLTRDDAAVMSQHLGDVGNVETLEALDHAAAHLLRLFDVAPAAVVADLHPGYLSAAWAERFAASRGIPCLRIQHHEAHVASLLAEHGFDPATAPEGFLAACFDGTGFGPDGEIRGSEFLAVDRGRFMRAAHLAPFPLPGGDASIRHPWRTALAVLHAVGIAWHDDLPPVASRSSAELTWLRRQLERTIGTATTTSMGRLIDAIAAIAGGVGCVTYEAEAAMLFEAAAAGGSSAVELDRYELVSPNGDGPVVIDWRPVVVSAVDRVRRKATMAEVAAAFHAATAGMIVHTCRAIQARMEKWGGGRLHLVGLTGGVFQNAILLEQTLDALHAAGFEVLTHHTVPPNDGGLALGQAVLGRRLVECR